MGDDSPISSEPSSPMAADSNNSESTNTVKDISPDNDGKLLKEIIKEGKGYQKPSNGDKVQVHYVGKLLDGTVFDSSRDRNEKFSFILGQKQVIEGWELSIKTMRRGEVAKFTISPEYAYGEIGSPPKIPPNATLVFEIELYDWLLEDLTKRKDGGVTKRIITDGEGYTNPNEGALCEIHLIGKYNDKIFEERDVTFNLGEGCEQNLIDGVEIAVRKMKRGELAEIHIKPQYAFGKSGRADFGIPPDYQQVVYTIKLKNFEKMKESYEMTNDERLEQSELAKTKGTKYFKESKYILAIKQYKRIVQYLGPSEDFKDESKTKRDNLVLAGHLNLAICYIKVKEYNDAIKSSTSALELDPQNEKALFRRGMAYYENKDYESSLKDFNKVVELDPNNKAAKNYILQCQSAIKAQIEKEKKIYKNMFDIFAKRDEKLEKSKKQEEPKWIKEDAANDLKRADDENMGNVEMLQEELKAATHWIVTEDGKVTVEDDSVFQLRRPHDLVAFLKQEKRVQELQAIKSRLIAQKHEIESDSRSTTNGEQDGDDVEKLIYTSNDDCIKAGQPLTQFDLYQGTQYFIIPPEEVNNLLSLDYGNDEKHGDIISIIDDDSDLKLPNCSQIMSLDFSMKSYEHLFSVRHRHKLSIEPEVDLFQKVTIYKDLKNYGLALNDAFKKNSSSWILYTLASYYWRSIGHAEESIECLRRALDLSPYKYRNIPLISLGNVLHRSKNSDEAAIVLHQAIDIVPDIPVAHYTLGNVYAVMSDYNKSVICYDNVLKLDSSLDDAKFRKHAVLCHSSIEKALKAQHDSLQKTLEDLQDYQKQQELWLQYQQKLLSEQELPSVLLEQRLHYREYNNKIRGINSSNRKLVPGLSPSNEQNANKNDQKRTKVDLTCSSINGNASPNGKGDSECHVVPILIPITFVPPSG